MKNHTDSCIVEYNEDGTKTVTTIETYTPPTKGQTALAWTGVTLLVFAPVLPLLAIGAYEKYEEKRDARKAAKKLKSVKD